MVEAKFGYGIEQGEVRTVVQVHLGTDRFWQRAGQRTGRAHARVRHTFEALDRVVHADAYLGVREAG